MPRIGKSIEIPNGVEATLKWDYRGQGALGADILIFSKTKCGYR